MDNYYRRANLADQYGPPEEPYYPDNGYAQQPFDYTNPGSYLQRIDQYLQSQVHTISNQAYYLIGFIMIVLIILIFFLIYGCLTNPAKTKKSLETIWERDAKPLIAKRLKRKTLAQRVGDALVSDHHSMRSDDYEDFLRYKAKMMKYRQMEAQRKKQQNKFKNRNLVNWRYPDVDSANDQYKRITRDQISKLARKEKSCLIDLDGMDGQISSRYVEREPLNSADPSPV